MGESVPYGSYWSLGAIFFPCISEEKGRQFLFRFTSIVWRSSGPKLLVRTRYERLRHMGKFSANTTLRFLITTNLDCAQRFHPDFRWANACLSTLDLIGSRCKLLIPPDSSCLYTILNATYVWHMRILLKQTEFPYVRHEEIAIHPTLLSCSRDKNTWSSFAGKKRVQVIHLYDLILCGKTAVTIGQFLNLEPLCLWNKTDINVKSLKKVSYT